MSFQRLLSSFYTETNFSTKIFRHCKNNSLSFFWSIYFLSSSRWKKIILRLLSRNFIYLHRCEPFINTFFLLISVTPLHPLAAGMEQASFLFQNVILECVLHQHDIYYSFFLEVIFSSYYFRSIFWGNFQAVVHLSVLIFFFFWI